MPKYNPFLFPNICTLKKYKDKNISYEKMMFTDYPYLYWINNNLNSFCTKGIVKTLLDIGENPRPTAFCRNCQNTIALKICFYRGNFLTSCYRTVNTNFLACCARCEYEYLGRGPKHHSTNIQFSSILNFDTVHDRKIFVDELKYAIRAPARLSNENTAKYFYDLFELTNLSKIWHDLY